MKVDHIGVHQTHCCKKHGCKYGDRDCPVEFGDVIQEYACESGDFDDGCFDENLFTCEVDGVTTQFHMLTKEQKECLNKLYQNYIK